MPAYTPRIVDRELDQLLGALPAIAIEGAKGVGKTATAERRARTSFRLDEPAQAAIASADPSIIVESPPPLHPPTHSGAGRIVSLRMRPLTLAERNLGDSTVSLAALLAGNRLPVTGQTTVGLREYAREIIASGFPGLRHLSGRALRAQLDGYLARIVDRDFLEQGRSVRRPETLQRWLRAYAAATATTAALERIRDAAASGEGDPPTRATVGEYREILERLWIVDSVPGWVPSRNQLSRLTQAPKHHLADPGLAAFECTPRRPKPACFISVRARGATRSI